MSQITTGQQLVDFMTALNGGATIDIDLLNVLVENAKAILEGERPWVVLRKTDTSKTVSGNTWQTAIDLSTITDFSDFYVLDDAPVVRLFDGNNTIHDYFLKPIDQRLDWKDDSTTCVYDENSKTLYLNGTPPFSGTLHIPYIAVTDDIDLSSTSAIWTVFPKRFLPVLAYYAIGIYKGGVDYDSINRQMLPTNQSVLMALKNAMETWDDKKQLNVVMNNDPSNGPGVNGGWGNGRINRWDD